MSTAPKVDLFADISLSQNEFWNQAIQSEVQKLTKSHESDVFLNKETSSNESDDSENIEIVKEIPRISLDFLIQGETHDFEVHSIPNINQHTNPTSRLTHILEMTSVKGC